MLSGRESHATINSSASPERARRRADAARHDVEVDAVAWARIERRQWRERPLKGLNQHDGVVAGRRRAGRHLCQHAGSGDESVEGAAGDRPESDPALSAV